MDTPVTPTRRLAPAEIQEFLFHEAQLLNDRQFEAWLDLLTEDAIYWVPARHGQTSGDTEISLFYDTRSIIDDRIIRLRHPQMWSQLPPAITSRLVSNIMIEGDPSADTLTVHSVFVMVEHRNRRETRTFGGSYEHQLRRAGGTWKIAKKTVRLVNCDETMANLATPF